MAINFPLSPAPDAVYTYGDRTWTWNGRYWKATSTTIGYAGSQGYTGSIGYTGSKGDTGLGFTIAKTYNSVAALLADTNPTGIPAGQFAIIETGDAENTDNSRIYLWNGVTYSYVGDISGSQGIKGETGYTGSQGTTGYTGSIGGLGYTGSRGADGILGGDGYTGSSGYSGSAGFTGSAGIGFTGYSGSLGYTGSAGSIGFTGYSGSAGSTGPKITSVTVTDSSYNNLDDTAVALTGGYIKIGGSGFESGCQVLLGTTLATSVSYISSTEVRVQLPAASTGTYIIYLVNSDGGTAIRVNAVTFSPTPSWTTGAALSGSADTAISIQLAATDATSYALAAGSSLPSGITLSSGGLLSGTITGLSANTTYNFTIIATDAELQDSTRAFVFEITVGDTYFKYVSLLLAGNGTNLAQNNTFIDSSTNNFSITRAGNVSQGTFTPYGSNWSYFNNGASNYLNFGNQTALHLGSGDFTIEMWLWKNANTTYMTACGDFASASSNTFQILGNDDGTKLGVYSGASNSFVIMSVSSIPINTWTHVAFVRNSTTLTLYINGVSDVTATYSTNLNASTSFFIGHTPELNAGRYWNGYISNFRMVKGTAVYTGAFTPSTTPLTSISGTVLLTCQSNRFIDNSTNNFAITVSGSPSVQRFSPFSPTTAYSTIVIGGSGYLSGASSTWLAVPINATFAFGTNNYTYEAWVYPTAFPNAYNTIFCNYRDDEGAKGWSLLITSTGLIHVNNQGTYNNSTNALLLNTWTHIAVCRVGNTVTRYINGVADPTTLTVTASITNVAAQGPTIGGSPEYSTTREWTGYISNARVISRTALYTSNFTPSTTPLTAITNTSLLLNYTSAGVYDSTMINDLETVGDAKLSTAQSKFGGSSMYFDGTGDYLYSPPSVNYAMGSGDFTIEFWYYPVSQNAAWNPNIMGNYNITWTTNKWAIHAPHSSAPNKYTVWVNNYSNSPMLTSTSNITNGAWVHIAITRSGSTWKMFINGTTEATATSSTALDGGTAASMDGLYIGANFYSGDGGRYINAYINDLRITKGYARYTANFTPPASALPAQ